MRERQFSWVGVRSIDVGCKSLQLWEKLKAMKKVLIEKQKFGPDLQEACGKAEFYFKPQGCLGEQVLMSFGS